MIDDLRLTIEELADLKLRVTEFQSFKQRQSDVLQVDVEQLSKLLAAAEIGVKWQISSSLEEWFPITFEKLRKLETPLCIGWPTINLLRENGQHLFDSGHGLIAASDLFNCPDYKAENARLRQALECLAISHSPEWWLSGKPEEIANNALRLLEPRSEMDDNDAAEEHALRNRD